MISLNPPQDLQDRINECRMDWQDLVLKNSDLFMTDHSGYWMRGVDRDDKEGWLVQECTGDGEWSREDEEEALIHWGDHYKLPSGYYRLGIYQANRIFDLLLAEHGCRGVEGGCDANDYDVAIQTVLLGEVRYS